MNRSEVGKLGRLAATKGLAAYHKQARLDAIEKWKGKTCPACGDAIPFEKRSNKFCNRSCAAKHNNLGVARNVSPESRIITGCAFCGANISRRTRYDLIFCNNKCSAEYRHKEFITKWLAGKETGTKKSGGFSSHLKKYLLEKHQGQCSQCGWHELNPYTNKAPLEIHHKDGNSQNNTEENLVLLCPNCHSLTSTYRALNAGHGRKERKQ